MRSIGFIVSSLGGQLGYRLLRGATRYYQGGGATDILAFVQDPASTAITPPFAVMNVAEAFDFPGAVVATSVGTAENLLTFPGPSRRFFYAWDLEWLRYPGRSEDFLRVYRSPHLDLVARCDSHARLLERCWNTKVSAVSDDPISLFLELLDGQA